MSARRKPLESSPDPALEAALAASMERLQRRCAEAAGKKVEGGSVEGTAETHVALPDGAKPSTTPAASVRILDWQERVKGTNYQHDTTGLYTVSAARVQGTYVFSAYFGRNPGSVLGAAQKTAQAAREIAEAHARAIL